MRNTEAKRERKKERRKKRGEETRSGEQRSFCEFDAPFLSGKETVAAKPNRGLIGLLGLDVIPSIVNTLRDTKRVSPSLSFVPCIVSRHVSTRSNTFLRFEHGQLTKSDKEARKWRMHEILNLKIREKSISF